MPHAKTLSKCNISSVHYLVSSPFPPMNLKSWTVLTEKVFNCHHLGQSLKVVGQWETIIFIVEKQFFPAVAALPRHYKNVFLSTQSRFRVLFCKSSSKLCYKGLCTHYVGHALNPITLNIGDLVWFVLISSWVCS